MTNEEVNFALDVIQDTRINAGVEEKYKALVELLFRNSRLNWSHNGLALKSDDKIFTLLEALEPSRYDKVFKEIFEKEMLNEKK